MQERRDEAMKEAAGPGAENRAGAHPPQHAAIRAGKSCGASKKPSRCPECMHYLCDANTYFNAVFYACLSAAARVTSVHESQPSMKSEPELSAGSCDHVNSIK